MNGDDPPGRTGQYPHLIQVLDRQSHWKGIQGLATLDRCMPCATLPVLHTTIISTASSRTPRMCAAHLRGEATITHDCQRPESLYCAVPKDVAVTTCHFEAVFTINTGLPLNSSYLSSVACSSRSQLDQPPIFCVWVGLVWTVSDCKLTKSMTLSFPGKSAFNS